MAVTQMNPEFGKDGLADSLADFQKAHFENTVGILNAADNIGKPSDLQVKVNAPRPAYDPNHPDNQWPTMVHHAALGELAVGTNLKGIEDANRRKSILAANQAAYRDALERGYRDEPYPKPQIAVMDPAVEKAELRRQNAELQGQINAMQDRMDKWMAALQPAQPK